MSVFRECIHDMRYLPTIKAAYLLRAKEKNLQFFWFLVEPTESPRKKRREYARIIFNR